MCVLLSRQHLGRTGTLNAVTLRETMGLMQKRHFRILILKLSDFSLCSLLVLVLQVRFNILSKLPKLVVNCLLQPDECHLFMRCEFLRYDH